MDNVETVLPRIDRLGCVVAEACRLAARHPDLRSVSVVLGRRPTYAEVIRARNLAEGCGLDLGPTWVTAEGVR